MKALRELTGIPQKSRSEHLHRKTIAALSEIVTLINNPDFTYEAAVQQMATWSKFQLNLLLNKAAEPNAVLQSRIVPLQHFAAAKLLGRQAARKSKRGKLRSRRQQALVVRDASIANKQPAADLDQLQKSWQNAQPAPPPVYRTQYGMPDDSTRPRWT